MSYTVGLRKRLKARGSCRLSGVCRGGEKGVEERKEGERVGGRDTGKAKATGYQMTWVSLLVGTGEQWEPPEICSQPPPYAGARWIEACGQWGGKHFRPVQPVSQWAEVGLL